MNKNNNKLGLSCAKLTSSFNKLNRLLLTACFIGYQLEINIF